MGYRTFVVPECGGAVLLPVAQRSQEVVPTPRDYSVCGDFGGPYSQNLFVLSQSGQWGLWKSADRLRQSRYRLLAGHAGPTHARDSMEGGGADAGRDAVDPSLRS